MSQSLSYKQKNKRCNNLSYLWTSYLQMCPSEMQRRWPGSTPRLEGAFSLYKIPTGDWRDEHFHPLVPFPRKDYVSRRAVSVFIWKSAPPLSFLPETTFQTSQSSNPIVILPLQSVISILETLCRAGCNHVSGILRHYNPFCASEFESLMSFQRRLNGLEI